MIEEYEKDLVRLREQKKLLVKDYRELYDTYVMVCGNMAVQSAELTECLSVLEAQRAEWNVIDQEYNDRINGMAAEQMEMAIKIKHLERELNLYEKGKKKPPRKKKEVDE